MTTLPIPAPTPHRVPTQSTYQTRVADYWNAEENPVNLELGKIDDLYHHHYGIGDADRSVLDEPDPARRRERITARTAPAGTRPGRTPRLPPRRPLPRPTGSSTPAAGAAAAASWRICGYGCHADGVTISAKQADFANEQARRRGIDDKVRYHQRNMLDTGLAIGRVRGVLEQRVDDVRRAGPAVRRARPAAATRRPLRGDHRLLQRHVRPGVPRGVPDQRPLHLRHPPALGVLPRDGPQPARARPRRGPHRGHRSPTGSCARRPTTWSRASRTPS